MVTHDREVAEHGGRIITLRDGRLVTDEPVRDRRGTPAGAG
jgi:ABC-type lipoprotein export system ATPase subunit